MKMKSIIAGLALMAAATFSTVGAQAQDVFNRGTNVVSLLVGVGGSLVSTSNMIVPPIQFNYEHGLVDGLIDGKASVGAGIGAGYAASKYTIFGSRYITNYGFVGARGSFHYQFIPKLDAYLGALLGAGFQASNVKVVDYTSTVNSNDSNVGFAYGVYAGARYYFTPNIAVNTELGYGISIFNLGVTFRF